MERDRSSALRRTALLTVLSTALSLAATAAVRAWQRRRSATEAWARSTDDVPAGPRPGAS